MTLSRPGHLDGHPVQKSRLRALNGPLGVQWWSNDCRRRDVTRNNLPVALISFVGRKQEVVEVLQLLAAARRLMLTGTGGCGTTRLALRVAADFVAAYPNGVR